MMAQTVAVLGRQPALGIAELESIFGAAAIRRVGTGTAAELTLEPSAFPMERLGGTIKAAKLLTYLPFTNWGHIEAYLAMALPKHLPTIPEGKIRLGLSTYGLNVNLKRQNATGLELKKVIKQAGRSVRVIPNNASELNTAQVQHNQLTGPTGLELLLIADGKQVVLAQTFAVQDIDAYAARDQARPKRDARVGMLPPKLAQIITNLASPKAEGRLLDPFCGTGVVLQEAALMGMQVYGTDIDERMVRYARDNLNWLQEKYALGMDWFLEIADACDHHWQAFDTIACETYLGRPFSAIPAPAMLEQVIKDVDTIHTKFLKNLAKQTKPGFRLCIGVPAWKTKTGFKHLKTLDSLEKMGYTRVSFARARKEDLIYHRPDQIVARELVVLTRK